MNRSARYRLLVTGGLVTTVVAGIAGLAIGASDIPWSDGMTVLLERLLPVGWVDASGVDAVDRAIVWSMRAPRVVLAFLVGSSLALAGALMQAVFRNPLAAPGIIGTSAGASSGAIAAFALGLSMRSIYYVPLLSVVGAFVALLLVVRVASRGGALPVATLLLAGVALSSLLGAVNSWLIARAWDEWEVARRISFWLLGGIQDRGWEHVAMQVPCVAFGLAMVWRHRRSLDLLLETDDTARALGVSVQRARLQLLIAAALLTGGAVAVAGIVGFVGLVVPHMVRLVTGPAHARLLPATVLTGGWFVLAADLVARTATRPVELHLGVVTALVGAPFFLWLLRRHDAEVHLS